jgi:hypothetical protein
MIKAPRHDAAADKAGERDVPLEKRPPPATFLLRPLRPTLLPPAVGGGWTTDGII